MKKKELFEETANIISDIENNFENIIENIDMEPFQAIMSFYKQKYDSIKNSFT